MFKKKPISVLFVVAIFATLLAGCNILNYKKIEKSIFTFGDYVCLPNEDDTITILELSEQGKEKEVLVIPEKIDGKKVVSLGGSTWEDRKDGYHVFESQKLKKMYLTFKLEKQKYLNDHEREYVDAIVNIPNAVVVSGNESYGCEFACTDGEYITKGIVISKNNYDYWTQGGNNRNYIVANVNFWEMGGYGSDNESLWIDYVDDTVTEIRLPVAFEGKEEVVTWRVMEENDTTKAWDGTYRPGSNLAACHGISDGNFWGQYSSSDDVFSVCGLIPSSSGIPERLVIPSEINGNTVEEIENYAFKGLPIKEVVIPDTVKSIGNKSFGDCTELRNVTFEENSSCEILYMCAFSNCSSLTSFSAPDAMRKIYSAFDGCSSLAVLDLNNCTLYAESVGCNAIRELKANENNTYLTVDDGVALYCGDEWEKSLCCFANAADVTSYVIRGDCRAIRFSVFEGNTSLTKISGGGNFLNIYDNAFKNCTNLDEVDLRATSVGANAFYGCSDLDKICLRGNGNVFYGPDCLKGTPEGCVLYVPQNKYEAVVAGAEDMGFTGTVSALE